MPANKDYCNTLPKKVGRADFNKYIASYLSHGTRGPKPNISKFKTFNYILRVLHTGIQWEQLKTYKNEIHWSNIYKWHNRWSKDGSYENLLTASIAHLNWLGKLDLSILHGDGSNTVAKKGGTGSVTQVTNISAGKKPLL